MMEQKNLVPKRRFKEFQNAPAWEKRKLVDLCTTFTDGDWIEAKDQSDNGIRLIQTGNVGVNEFIDKADKSKWITEDTFNRLNCSEVYPGDILISRLPEPAGRACIVPNFEKRMITAVDCTIVRTSDECNKKYLVQYLSSESYFKSVNNFLAGGTRQRISRSNLANFIVPLPSKPEQKKIGAVLDRLDNLITLHQRKLEKMKALKSAYLSEMFPAEGERVPKRRFAGFTQAWEQRKLKELAGFSKGNGYTKNDLTDEGKPIILYGQLYTNYETVIESVNTFTNEKENSVISEGNEVIVPASGETSEDISRASVVGTSGIILGGDLNIVKPHSELDSTFLALTISNGKQRKELVKRAQGKSIVHLHNSDLKEINLLFPKKEEQIQIGNFFKQLDNLITLHQRKLEKLQNIKKAYLNEMFV